MSRLQVIDRDSWEAHVSSPAAVLMLGKSDCPACAAWTEELTTFLETDDSWTHVRFGKLLLDKPGLIAFKRASPWLSDVDVLPFNVLYAGGKLVKSYAGSGIDRLVNRMLRVYGSDAPTAPVGRASVAQPES